MKLLEERIRKDGVVRPGNVLKVDSFLNHQMDVIFFNEMAKEFKRLYEGVPINKILTIEASGIGIAIMAGLHLEVPVVFAKKSRSSNISDQVYHTVIHSYTHNHDNDVVVSKQYLNEDDHILIIDDFLANGCALEGLIDLVHQANATKRAFRRAETVCARRAIVWNHWPSSTAWIRKPEKSRSAAVKTDCGFLLPCWRRHCE